MKLTLAVIILQNCPEVLEEIGLCVRTINPDAFRQTFFVTTTDKALACMSGATRTVVISGNVISLCLGDGVKFAAEVKAVRPETPFLIYSTHPTPDPLIDGYIPKAGLERLDPARHLPLASVVARITYETTRADILRFPEVVPWPRVAA